jgi:hypothetical protein
LCRQRWHRAVLKSLNYGRCRWYYQAFPAVGKLSLRRMDEMAAGEGYDIETIGTRIVYENRWMRVREDGRSSAAAGFPHFTAAGSTPVFANSMPAGSTTAILANFIGSANSGHYITITSAAGLSWFPRSAGGGGAADGVGRITTTQTAVLTAMDPTPATGIIVPTAGILPLCHTMQHRLANSFGELKLRFPVGPRMSPAVNGGR